MCGGCKCQCLIAIPFIFADTLLVAGRLVFFGLFFFGKVQSTVLYCSVLYYIVGSAVSTAPRGVTHPGECVYVLVWSVLRLPLERTLAPGALEASGAGMRGSLRAAVASAHRLASCCRSVCIAVVLTGGRTQRIETLNQLLVMAVTHTLRSSNGVQVHVYQLLPEPMSQMRGSQLHSLCVFPACIHFLLIQFNGVGVHSYGVLHWLCCSPLFKLYRVDLGVHFLTEFCCENIITRNVPLCWLCAASMLINATIFILLLFITK